MADAISLEIKGLEEVQRKMVQVVADLQGAPILKAVQMSTLLIQSRGAKNAPIKTGRLRASIVPKIEHQSNVIRGIVGSNVTYAPFQELGWTTTKGTRVPGKRYLGRAIEESEERIGRIFSSTIKTIVDKK